MTPWASPFPAAAASLQCNKAINRFVLINSGCIHDCRFSYAWNAFASSVPDMEIWNCQFIDCNQPIAVQSYNTNVGIHNVLITMEDTINKVTTYCNCPPGGIFFVGNSTVNVYCEHLTANVQSQNYMSFYPSSDPSAAVISDQFHCGRAGAGPANVGRRGLGGNHHHQRGILLQHPPRRPVPDRRRGQLLPRHQQSLSCYRHH